MCLQSVGNLYIIVLTFNFRVKNNFEVLVNMNESNKTNYWYIVAHRLSLFSLLRHYYLMNSIETNKTYQKP